MQSGSSEGSSTNSRGKEGDRTDKSSTKKDDWGPILALSYSVAKYFVYTIAPYILSIAWTICGLFFPQIHSLSRIGDILKHPIAWLLGKCEEVDRRAEPLRRGDLAMLGEDVPPKEVRKETAAENARSQCCQCLINSKSILLQPCNHLCLCTDCFQEMNQHPQSAMCPICHTGIQAHIVVKDD